MKSQNPTSRTNTSRHRSSRPRVCVYSLRHLEQLVSRCVNYEFEDVIAEVDKIDLIAPCSSRYYDIGQKISNRLTRYVRHPIRNFSLETTQMERSYDLFFMICMFPKDLLTLPALKGWHSKSGVKICLLEEIWSQDVETFRGYLKLLSQFDYIIVNCMASAERIQSLIQKPCIYMPPGIDAIRFCPYPYPVKRTIDIYSLGRKSQRTHTALLDQAEQDRIFYLYDTMEQMRTCYYRQHRELIANIAKRSRYFLVNPAKANLESETHGQTEIGFRFFEGAAAGTVMIGEAPMNKAFPMHFGWKDSVVPLPYDSVHIDEVMNELESDPERVREIRKNNIVNSLLKHDWGYRWEMVLNMIGLDAMMQLRNRKEYLTLLSRIAEQDYARQPWRVKLSGQAEDLSQRNVPSRNYSPIGL